MNELKDQIIEIIRFGIEPERAELKAEEILSLITIDFENKITEIKSAANDYIKKLEDELTGQLTEGGNLDVDGLNKYLSKWKEIDL